MTRVLLIIGLIQLLTMSACAKSAHQTGRDLLDQVLPADLRQRIDSTVPFADLEAAPSSYVGRTVMVSGIVLTAKRAKDRTEIEVLQLPAEQGGLPSDDRSRSEGRFLAVENKFLDPATIVSGTPVTVDDLRQFGCTDIHESDAAYRQPLLRDARTIAAQLRRDAEVVLLGSVATAKYVDVLVEAFGDRLRFPAEFAGRGDMSRGGLLLRCAKEQRELEYIPVEGATLRGK